jgi:membrane-bound ClpP family serine protease
MTEILVKLTDWHAMEILFGLAVILVLIDYFFPVDFAAYLGYLCFAGGIFFAVPLAPGPSLVVAFLVGVLLLVLHKIWFGKYLANAYDRTADEES